MIVYRGKNKEEGGKPSSLVIHVYSAVKMWRASLKGSDGSADLHQKCLHIMQLWPRRRAHASIHQNIAIDCCNADTDHVASQPGIDQRMKNQ